MSRRTMMVAMVATGSLAFAGCGSSEDPAKAQEKAANVQAQQDCQANLGGLVSGLKNLDAAVSEGIGFKDYVALLGAAKHEYDLINVDEQTPSCIKEVGVPAENSLKLYVRAGYAWAEAIDSYIDIPESELDRSWVPAQRDLGEAVDGFDNVTADTASNDNLDQGGGAA